MCEGSDGVSITAADRGRELRAVLKVDRLAQYSPDHCTLTNQEDFVNPTTELDCNKVG